MIGVGILGAVLLIGLMLHSGLADVGRALAAIGWGLAALAGMRALQIAGAGLAWWCLLPADAQVKIATCIRLRWVREAINTLLPVAQMGGELVGARLLAHAGPSRGLAAASVIVDVFVQAATQLVFTFIGLGVLLALGGDATIVRNVTLGLLVLAPALAGFFLMQRHGGFGWIERQAMRLLRSQGLALAQPVIGLDMHIKAIYQNRRGLVAAVGVHFLVWLVGTSEIWTALWFMHMPVSLAAALVIESLAQAVRGAAFLVPAGLGVQEGGFVALCAMFGLSAPVALALSLAKRFSELVLGLSGMLVWQVIESRLLLKRAAVAQPARREDSPA